MTTSSQGRLLLVDDDPDIVSTMTEYLESKGYEVLSAHTRQQALETIKKKSPDLVLLDVNLPDGSGVSLISELHTLRNLPIIMVSAMSDTPLIVSSIKAGASDYIQKPFEHSDLLEKIKPLLELQQAKSVEKEIIQTEGYTTLVGHGIKTQQLIRDISKVSYSSAPVFLRGESGTGKSLVAELIHAHSPRKGKPFVSINCAAIPDNLLESEFFGHEKGAFTGAVQEKMGKFEYANGGI